MSQVHPKSQGGERLARDLRQIREKRGISVEQLIERTRATPQLVEQFEKDGLEDHPMFNRVYLRSFVRSYANLVGISEPDVLRAVEEMISPAGYTGSLAITYLDERPAVDASETSPPAPVEEPKHPVASAPRETAESKRTKREQRKSAAPPPKAPPKAPTTAPTKASKAPAKPAPIATAKPSSGTAGQPSRTPISWPPAIKPSLSEKLRPLTWIVPAVIVISLLAVWSMRSTPEPEQPRAPAPVILDTVVTQPAPRIVLGDTMQVSIIASRDALDPVRMTVDRGIRRPYWISLLDTMHVSVANQIILERRLNNMDLLVDGRPYPTGNLVPGQPLVITREAVQARLDSLGR